MRWFPSVVVVLVLCLLAPAAWAGPTWISIEIPPRPWGKAAERGALFVVRAPHIAEHDGKLTATAEGRVDGKRRTIALRLDPRREKDTWGVTRQWPTRGKWVLVFRASGHVASTAVVDLRRARMKRERFGSYVMGRERFDGQEYWRYEGLSVWSQVGDVPPRKLEKMLAAGVARPTAPPWVPREVGLVVLGLVALGAGGWAARRRLACWPPISRRSVNGLGPVAS